MKWIKASERLPEVVDTPYGSFKGIEWDRGSNRIPFRYKGELLVGRYIKEKLSFKNIFASAEMDRVILENEFEEVYWLDETEPESPSTPILGAELKKIEGFTPGPWRSVGHIKGHNLAMWIFGKDPSPDTDRELQVISMTDSHVVKEHLERRMADMHLMAYAPELYKLAGQYRDECGRLRGLLVEIMNRPDTSAQLAHDIHITLTSG